MNRKKLEKLAWSKTSKDYRSVLGSDKCVLRWVAGVGTTLVALSDLSEDELKKIARIKE